MHHLLNEPPQAAAGLPDPKKTLAKCEEYEHHSRINPLQAALFNSGLFLAWVRS